MNILNDIFGQQPALRNTFLDICKSFSVIDYFIDLAQGLSACLLYTSSKALPAKPVSSAQIHLLQGARCRLPSSFLAKLLKKYFPYFLTPPSRPDPSLPVRTRRIHDSGLQPPPCPRFFPLYLPGCPTCSCNFRKNYLCIPHQPVALYEV